MRQQLYSISCSKTTYGVYTVYPNRSSISQVDVYTDHIYRQKLSNIMNEQHNCNSMVTQHVHNNYYNEHAVLPYYYSVM